MAKERARQSRNLKTVKEVVPADVQVDVMEKMDDLVGTQITIESLSTRRGKTGEYFFIIFKRDGDEKLHGVTCGGIVVKKKLQYLMDNNSLPVLATFDYPAGKNYLDVN